MRVSVVPFPTARGFSLVDILVALAIGLLINVVVLRLMVVVERRNLTAAGGAEAHSNAIVALYQMEQHIQNAGWGIATINLLNCPLRWRVKDDVPIARSVLLAPVGINPRAADGQLLLPPGDTGTDTLLVLSGNSDHQPDGSPVRNAVQSSVNPTAYTLHSSTGIAVADRVILAPDTAPAACAAGLWIDRVTQVDGDKVTLAAGGVTVGAAPALYNLGPGPNGPNVRLTSTVPTNGPTILAYAVRAQRLTVCDFNVHDCSLPHLVTKRSVWVPVASQVVGLRAAYLYRMPVEGASFSPLADAAKNETSQPATPCAWARVAAIHLELDARDDAIAHSPQALIQPLEADISIRNMAWMNVPGACLD